jgi:hypothetical protein
MIRTLNTINYCCNFSSWPSINLKDFFDLILHFLVKFWLIQWLCDICSLIYIHLVFLLLFFFVFSLFNDWFLLFNYNFLNLFNFWIWIFFLNRSEFLFHVLCLIVVNSQPLSLSLQHLMLLLLVIFGHLHHSKSDLLLVLLSLNLIFHIISFFYLLSLLLLFSYWFFMLNDLNFFLYLLFLGRKEYINLLLHWFNICLWDLRRRSRLSNGKFSGLESWIYESSWWRSFCKMREFKMWRR